MYDGIATDSVVAGVGTPITVLAIAVVTLFDARLDVSITTTGIYAGAQTRIGVELVPVVTLFTRLHDPITATA